MIPAPFPAANRMYVGPEGVLPLPALESDGWCTSMWALEEADREELKRLLASGTEIVVYLSVNCPQPIVCLQIGAPKHATTQAYPSGN